MRRSVEEGVNNRFVTGDRLQAVLKVCNTDDGRGWGDLLTTVI